MVYKIEDIDWSQIPEGAVEFALENDDYIACWYNKNGEYSAMVDYSGWHEAFIDPEDPEDDRVRYKVSDYHPSSNLIMSDADTVEHFLKELSELSNKYKVVIYGCPSLYLEDSVNGGHYTVSDNNEFLEYIHEG